MNFKQFIEEEEIRKWLSISPRSTVQSIANKYGMRPDDKVIADALIKLLPPNQFNFLVKDMADHLMSEMENEGFKIQDILFYFELPYYNNEPDENEPYNSTDSVRKWVLEIDKFVNYAIQLPVIIQRLNSERPEKQEKMKHMLHVRLEQELAKEVRSRIMKKYENADYVINVYGSSRAYGGAEEGGWWYDDKDLMYQKEAKGLRPAYRKYLELRQMYKGKGQDSFYKDLEKGYNGVRDAKDSEDGQEGMMFSRGWKPSQYEKYDVELALKGAKTSETQAPPHYS